MNRVVAFAYGTVVYVIFFVTFCYMIGFVGDFGVPKSIDSGPEGSPGAAYLINIALLGLFGLQHSVMARPGFKAWWTTIVPKPIERSTFVLFTSLILILMVWQWRPMAGVIWEVEGAVGRFVLWALFWFGWALVLVSTFIIDHFDLFGLRQVYLYLKGTPYTPPVFKVTTLYKIVRHPLLLGFMIAFWSTPHMTAGHFLFALITTLYMLIAIQLEERDLGTVHGEAYERYREEVRMILPLPRGKR
jgi:protein-S-isoprenylcysteine O-methyltransferase Ste14